MTLRHVPPEIEHKTPLFGCKKPLSQNSSESPEELLSELSFTEELQILDIQPEFENDSAPCSSEIEEHKAPLFGYEKSIAQNSSKSPGKHFPVPSCTKELQISNIQPEFKDDSTPCLPRNNSEDSDASKFLKSSPQHRDSDCEIENRRDSRECFFSSSQESVRELLEIYRAKIVNKQLQRFLNNQDNDNLYVNESQPNYEMEAEDSAESISLNSPIELMEAELRRKNRAGNPILLAHARKSNMSY